MDVEYPVRDLDPEASDEEEEEMEDMEDEEEEEEKGSRRKLKSGKKVAREHKTQLQRLKEKDPEFYKFLEENDKELLEFNDADFEEDVDTDMEIEQMQEEEENPSNSLSTTESKGVITTAMVDSWRMKVQEDGKISALRSLLKAFRVACHYGDDSGEDLSSKFSVMPSTVFNKVMLFALCEMDGILRNLLGLPSSGGRKENITDLMTTKNWKNYSHLVKSYLGNALHVLKQMTDTEMISFTVRRLKYSSVLLAAFPSLLRKYIKVVLHFWGTGGGALPVVSFLFLRELCIRIGSDCLDECYKGIYKAYVLNCQFINAVKLQHIQFLGNCVVELFRVDIPTAYQHAFVFIRQLAMILRDAITMKTKESFRKVYEWKFINCLELWTGAICAYSSETDFRPLAYPLIQVISGVARLVPTAQYFPLRLRCVQMLNRIAASTGTFVPVSMLLLDMLEMKELNRPPTGGVGTAVDLHTIIKVKKDNLKTRAFQEACVMSVVEELAEHLAQWSYSVAFFELSFIPAVRLRSFSKTTKVERFRKEMRHFIRQIEANCKFTNERRASITFLPNDPAAASFLEAEKKSGASPLSQYVATLRERAQQRKDSLQESSVIVGANSAVFGKKLTENDDDDDKNNKGAAVFSSSWLPGGEETDKPSSKEERKKKKKKVGKQEVALEEDVVEDLVLSSDDEEASSVSGSSSADERDENEELVSPEQQGKEKKQKLPSKSSKKKKSQPKKSKKKSSGTPFHHNNGKVDNAKLDQPAGKRSKKGGGPPPAISSKNDAQSRANKSKKRKRASR